MGDDGPGGELVKVAFGFGLATRGFGGGPQRVMVHANRAEQARALLAETLVEGGEATLPEVANHGRGLWPLPLAPRSLSRLS